jgi:hypothetical protein
LSDRDGVESVIRGVEFALQVTTLLTRAIIEDIHLHIHTLTPLCLSQIVYAKIAATKPTAATNPPTWKLDAAPVKTGGVYAVLLGIALTPVAVGKLIVELPLPYAGMDEFPDAAGLLESVVETTSTTGFEDEGEMNLDASSVFDDAGVKVAAFEDAGLEVLQKQTLHQIPSVQTSESRERVF